MSSTRESNEIQFVVSIQQVSSCLQTYLRTVAELRCHPNRVLRELTKREALLPERYQDSLSDRLPPLRASNHLQQH